MECLKILFMNVYGMEIKTQWRPTMRIREVWKNEGKDEEGRSEWEGEMQGI